MRCRCWAPPAKKATTRRAGSGRSFRQEAADRGHAEGHDARVLEERARRRRQGRQRADVDIIWKGPLKEDDLKAQIDVVQSFTAQGVSGIVLAPLNDKALVAPVKAAVKSGDPGRRSSTRTCKGTITRASSRPTTVAAGRLAGEKLGALLGGKGNVVVLRYQEGSASTHNREEGFLDAIRKFPDIKLVSDNQYGGATTESAFAASENLLLAQNAGKGSCTASSARTSRPPSGCCWRCRRRARRASCVSSASTRRPSSSRREGG